MSVSTSQKTLCIQYRKAAVIALLCQSHTKHIKASLMLKNMGGHSERRAVRTITVFWIGKIVVPKPHF